MARGDLRINLSRSEAQKVLEYLPGTPGLWQYLTDVFLASYQGEPLDEEALRRSRIRHGLESLDPEPLDE